MQYQTMYGLADAQWSAAKVPVVLDLRLSVVANPNQHGAGFYAIPDKAFGMYGGDDGARTRDLCRDRAVIWRNL